MNAAAMDLAFNSIQFRMDGEQGVCQARAQSRPGYGHILPNVRKDLGK